MKEILLITNMITEHDYGSSNHASRLSCFLCC
jgi:hypothetical protein